MDAQDNKINGNVDETIKENGHSNKGNEDKKIFVGGIAYDVTNEDLTSHFGQYGEVAQAQVKFDRVTGRSRGFAFVEFATGEGCKAALGAREQTIKNKQVRLLFIGGNAFNFYVTFFSRTVRRLMEVHMALVGFDQLVNVVLEDSHERVYSETQGVEQIPLGLYIIRGDNIAVIGEIDEELDKRIDLDNVKAAPLGAIWIQG
uniref:U6 snRNA-associated Sm-like protein LSm8 n=1 Tax=Heterorhabditis bacteriophora TaxID=37862 RepID=A0A1I7XFG4_HETBA